MSKSKALVIAALALGVTSGVNAQQQPAPPPLPQAPNMTFFVTGAGPGKGADLGGIEGADQHCQMLAQRHGAGGKTWHAYLSTQEADGKPAVNARDRIGNGPWQNFKGQVVATSVDDLHSDNNKLGFDTSLSERGQIIPGVGFAPNRHDALTGSTPEGRAFPTSPSVAAPAIGPTYNAECDQVDWVRYLMLPEIRPLPSTSKTSPGRSTQTGALAPGLVSIIENAKGRPPVTIALAYRH